MKPDVIKDASMLLPTLGMDNATPDRIVAIVCAAYADKYLEFHLREALPGANFDLCVKLFKETGLLGSFGAKIDIARAMGVIGPVTENDLKLIARVRNRFAHRLEIESFDHEDIAALVGSFRSQDNYVIQLPQIRRDAHRALVSEMTNRQKFAYNAGSVCISLSGKYDPAVIQNP